MLLRTSCTYFYLCIVSFDSKKVVGVDKKYTQVEKLTKEIISNAAGTKCAGLVFAFEKVGGPEVGLDDPSEPHLNSQFAKALPTTDEVRVGMEKYDFKVGGGQHGIEAIKKAMMEKEYLRQLEHLMFVQCEVYAMGYLEQYIALKVSVVMCIAMCIDMFFYLVGEEGFRRMLGGDEVAWMPGYYGSGVRVSARKYGSSPGFIDYGAQRCCREAYGRNGLPDACESAQEVETSIAEGGRLIGREWGGKIAGNSGEFYEVDECELAG
jgi:hypothetical protein